MDVEEIKVNAKNQNRDKSIVFDLLKNIDLHKMSTAQTNEEAIAGVTMKKVRSH